MLKSHDEIVEWKKLLVGILETYDLGDEPMLYSCLSDLIEETLEQRDAEFIEMVEGMRKEIDYTDTRVTSLDRNKYYRLKGYEQGRNAIVDALLTQLNNNK